MAVQLREPFFLHGRRSILQRAIMISSVLTGLAALAGWGIAATLVVSGQTNHSRSAIGWYFAFPVAWSVISVLFVHGPLNAWNGRSWIWTVLALAVGLLLMLQFAVWIDHPYRIGQSHRTLLPILVVHIASGLLQVRLSRLHLVAYLFSILGAILTPGLFALLYSRSQAFSVGPLESHSDRSVRHSISQFSTGAGTPPSACLGAFPFGGRRNPMRIPYPPEPA